MIVCPDCGFENIEGADDCEQCQQSLSEFSSRLPTFSVEGHLMRDQIAVLQPKQPLTVGPDAPAKDVLTKMIDQAIGCVVVVDGDNVVGIFTERDALQKINTDAAELASHPISEFMTHDPETLAAEDKLTFALHKMDLGGYRHVPILEEDRLAGVISVRDVLDYLTARIDT